MPEPKQERKLLDQWRAGDERAAKELFDSYVERLMALARRRISQRLASRVDPEDIVQSVFRTFFGRVKAGEFHFEDKVQDTERKILNDGRRTLGGSAAESWSFHSASENRRCSYSRIAPRMSMTFRPV